MNLTHYSGDDLVISVPVTFDVGAPVSSLTGGAATAIARRRDQTGSAVNGTAVIQPGGASIVATFADGAFSAGVYALQVKATVSGITQTLVDAQVTVLASL